MWSHYGQHSPLPGDSGQDEETVSARARLTELELHCPDKLHAAAVDLVNELRRFGNKPGGQPSRGKE